MAGDITRTSFARLPYQNQRFATWAPTSGQRVYLSQKGPYSAMPDVLVIDDSPTVRLTLRKWLEGAGYAVEEAADGMEGFNKLRASKEPLIVLLDYQMPKLSGYEVLQLALAEGNLLKKHGYIVISGQQNTFPPAFSEMLWQLSIQLLPKPFDDSALLAVTEYVERRMTTGQTGRYPTIRKPPS
jgi:CheY-like chemotaxis protein